MDHPNKLLGHTFKTSSQTVSCSSYRKVKYSFIYYCTNQQFGKLLETVHHDVNKHQRPVIKNTLQL